MALEGNIKTFGLPDIFQLIGLQRKTGILTLKTAEETVTVTFDNGMVVAADSSTKRLEERLGNSLLKQGKLSEGKLDEAQQVQKKTLQRLAHVLVANGSVSKDDLKATIQLQVSGTVFNLFRWKEGDYHFEPANSVDYDKENFKAMSADFILMEGIRMVDEWPIIEKKISSMDLVFRSVVDPSLIETGDGGEGDSLDDAFGGLGDSKPPPSNKVRLTGEEEKIFRLVNGTNTVQYLVDASGLGEFDACRVLFELLNRNLVAPVGRGAAAKQAFAGPAVGASPMPGYALLAVAVTLSVLGLFVHLTSPFGVLGVPALLADPYGLLLEDVSRTRVEKLDRAIVAYGLAHGQIPDSLQEVVDAGLVDPGFLEDPWGQPYAYSRTDLGYTLSAAEAASASAFQIERVLAPGSAVAPGSSPPH